MLEKALEIAAWMQATGVAFDGVTYEELCACCDVAGLWDAKALRTAKGPALLPSQLRPAPYDALRVQYLDHLEVEEKGGKES
jgi:hypothetical protein